MFGLQFSHLLIVSRLCPVFKVSVLLNISGEEEENAAELKIGDGNHVFFDHHFP